MEEYLRQLSDYSGVIIVFAPIYYTLFILCRVAGKKIGEYEHNKFIDDLSGRFYDAAIYGLIETWCYDDPNSGNDAKAMVSVLAKARVERKSWWI